MKGVAVANAFLLSLCLWNAFEAGPVPGRWEKVDALPRATALEVRLKSGERLDVQFEGSSDESISVRRSDGNLLELPKSAVQEVALSEIQGHDGVWNGLGIGAGIGFASFMIAHAATEGAPSGHDFFAASVYAVLGMGIGALVDAAVTDEVVLYRSN